MNKKATNSERLMIKAVKQIEVSKEEKDIFKKEIFENRDFLSERLSEIKELCLNLYDLQFYVKLALLPIERKNINNPKYLDTMKALKVYYTETNDSKLLSLLYELTQLEKVYDDILNFLYFLQYHRVTIYELACGFEEIQKNKKDTNEQCLSSEVSCL